MGVEKTQPRRPINKKNKTTVVFDENARKEFLTGFRKRKDERRKQWKEKVERQLKNEMKKIKAETKLKVRHTSRLGIKCFCTFTVHSGLSNVGFPTPLTKNLCAQRAQYTSISSLISLDLAGFMSSKRMQ